VTSLFITQMGTWRDAVPFGPLVYAKGLCRWDAQLSVNIQEPPLRFKKVVNLTTLLLYRVTNCYLITRKKFWKMTQIRLSNETVYVCVN
jgi:hypothetical protein